MLILMLFLQLQLLLETTEGDEKTGVQIVLKALEEPA